MTEREYLLFWLGFIVGNAFCFFICTLPIMRINKKYCERIESRIRKRGS